MKVTEKAFLRARQPEQIEERRRAILKAAEELFVEDGLENVSLKGIADRAGTTKSNIYRYFESREHIYLLILQQEGIKFTEKAKVALRKFKGQASISEAAAALTRAFAKSERYCLLMCVINSVLEKNLSAVQIANFRTKFLERRNYIAQCLVAAIPGAQMNQIAPLMIAIFAHVAGVWPLSHPTPECQKLFRKSKFAHLNLSFEDETQRFIETLLTGALVKVEPAYE